MPSHRHLAYRRNAQAAAKKHKVRKSDKEQLFEKARDDFGFFCEYVADKPPAEHHKEWHRQLVTNNDSSCLLKIAGPNIDLLGPRGSAKSTVLGLFTAWAIGIHTQAKKPLQILYLSYTVDIARSKSATIKRIIESKKYQEVFPTVKLLKNVTSNEYWSIDHKFAGIDVTGEEQFTLCAAGLKGSVTSKRSQLVVIDDPIKSASDIGNPDIRKMMQDNWNAVIAGWMEEAVLYVPHITKMYVGGVILASILYRGILLPLKRKIGSGYLLPYRWIKVGMLGLSLDLVKAPWYAAGSVIGTFKKLKTMI